ncbi:hypothetical protein [Pseudarthrobacter sp. NamE5]|uniref:hypothetical protein n=1 Tax=Pseudarthrobacter sp. NamE5 TaxID=2576839 RepID=UPI00110A7A72|nr:hypothetical protein [Pseudarthrobacter sp. NamE5]TLM84190.1 hypothetical protein FDW84_11545 [Pseudarthrobacter sp. NamE5]
MAIELIDIAGLLMAAVLLVTLVTLEVRHAGPDLGQATRPRHFGQAAGRIAVAVLWIVCLLLFLPRLLELLT